MRKSRNLLAVGLLSAMFMMTGGQAYAGELADTVYHGGKIYTMTETKEQAANNDAQTVEVVVTKDGKILYAGPKDDAEKAGYFDTDKVDTIVNLDGKAMYPGFIDGHGHFHDMGPNDLYKVNLNSPLLDGTVTCIQDIIDLMKEKAAATEKGKVVEGWNYDDTMLKEMRHPTREDLDKISTEHPIYLRHISGHVAAVNTKALEIAGWPAVDGIQTEVEGDYKTANGVLIETKAMDAVSNKLNAYRLPQSTQASIARCAQVYAAAGVTTADAGATAALNVVPDYQQAIAEGNLPIRVLVHPMGIYEADSQVPDPEANWQKNVFMDGIGWAGRAQLGWKNKGEVPSMPGPDVTDKITQGIMYANYMRYDWFSDGTDAVQLGEDITNYPVVKVNLQGAPYAVDIANGTPAYDPKNLPENRLMLGAWKILFDGSPQAYSAWMKSPGYYDWGVNTAEDDYYKAGYFSTLAPTNLTVPTLEKWLDIYHSYGQSTEIHCNGSAASEAWVAALEKTVWANKDNPLAKDTRHTSIHGQTMELQHVARVAGNYAEADWATKLPSITDLKGAYDEADPMSKVDKAQLGEEMAKQNIFVSFFDNHVYFYGDRHRDIFFGPGRAMNISPTGWAEHYGVRYSFHNDTFVTPISPLRSITSAVNRLTADGKLLTGEGKDIKATKNYAPRKEAGKNFEEIAFSTYDHRITPIQAIRAVTVEPAWQNKVLDRIGTIEEGKLADFTILAKDILAEAKVEEGKGIVDIPVATTIVGDEVVFGVLPGSESISTPGVTAGYEQPADNALSVISVKELSKGEVIDSGNYAPLLEGDKFLASKQFEANVAEEANAVFSFVIQGVGADGEKVANLKLNKVLANERHLYAYGQPDDLTSNSACGKWWLANFQTGEVLDKNAELDPAATYIVNFVIGDNSKFDSNDAPGVIEDPLVLSSGEPESTGGGSSGGCTVGTNPAYELLALLLAALGVTAARGLRRRDA